MAEIIVPVPAGDPPAEPATPAPAETPAAPASAVVPDPSQPEKPRGFDPLQTVHVLARQSKEVLEDTLGLLASKNPHGIFDDPATPAVDPKPPEPALAGPDEATKK